MGLFAINYGPCADPEVAVRVARHAEAAGFESVWTAEHIVLPDPQPRGFSMPPTLPFLDTVELKALTGSVIRSTYLSPGQTRAPRPNAVIVAPATYNTISKCALGISDTYALGLLAEAIGLPIPVVMLPFVNSALAGRRPFERAVVQLRHEGVHVLLGDGTVDPHPPGTGSDHIDTFPWQLAIEALEAAELR